MRAAVEGFYRRLTEAGIETLYDDRPERAGVKFNDADLLGIPLRLTLGRRAFQQEAVEIKARAGGEARQAPLVEAVGHVREELDRLRAGIVARVGPVAFDAG